MSQYSIVNGYFKFGATSNIVCIRKYQLRKMMHDITHECDMLQARCNFMSRRIDTLNIPRPYREKIVKLNYDLIVTSCKIDNMNEDAVQGLHKNNFDSFADDFLTHANNLVDMASDFRRLYVNLLNMVYTE